jgi:hypothetical protein
MTKKTDADNEALARLIDEASALSAPRTILKDHRAHVTPDDARRVLPLLETAKQQAVAQGDELQAKAAWCLRQVAKIQEHYLQAWEHLTSGAFYAAWCELDRCEIEIHHLDRHYKDVDTEYGLEFIRTQSKNLQAMYPYKWFLSPEILKKKVVCSICGATVTPRNPCPHRSGDIFGGEMAAREIVEMDVIGMALVTEPHQNYSVLFTGDPDSNGIRDQYDYALIRYVRRGLRSPWHGWTYSWTTRLQPHELFAHLGRTSPCPCDSGKQYEDCCWNKDGVPRPHCDIEFDVAPPRDLPSYEYH